jgi:hypothetical protein
VIIAALTKLTWNSILIQAADTYLHVTTEAVESVHIQAESISNYAYSRGLVSKFQIKESHSFEIKLVDNVVAVG